LLTCANRLGVARQDDSLVVAYEAGGGDRGPTPGNSRRPRPGRSRISGVPGTAERSPVLPHDRDPHPAVRPAAIPPPWIRFRLRRNTITAVSAHTAPTPSTNAAPSGSITARTKPATASSSRHTAPKRCDRRAASSPVGALRLTTTTITTATT